MQQTEDYWRQWEKRIEEECALKYWPQKIHKRIICPPGRRPMQKKSGPDFNVMCLGLGVVFDAKTCDGKTFNIKENCQREKYQKQFSDLCDAHDRGGVPSGYLVWFYNERIYSWIHISTIRMSINAGVKSLGPTDPGVKTKDDAVFIDIYDLACR